MTSFEARIPEPMITRSVAGAPASTSNGQLAGRPMGVMPPYSNAGLGHGNPHRRERHLARTQVPADKPVDIRSCVREDDACSQPLLAAAASSNDDAIRRLVSSDAIAFTERRGVGHGWIDLGHLDQLTRPVPGAERGGNSWCQQLRSSQRRHSGQLINHRS